MGEGELEVRARVHVQAVRIVRLEYFGASMLKKRHRGAEEGSGRPVGDR